MDREMVNLTPSTPKMPKPEEEEEKNTFKPMPLPNCYNPVVTTS